MKRSEHTYSEVELRNILSNYHWMIKEVKRINDILSDVDSNITGQYGIEATLPKPKGLTKDAMTNEVIRRDKKRERKLRLLNKIEYVQNKISLITDEREKVVLDCLLDGMSINAISNHMGLSRKHIERLRESIVNKMSQMSQMSHNF
ncbi:LuxR C-terminal-related transcriptional regulator [Virgibacillus halodenitrificans]|uniref:LuxR C-terminal-related transcriptional regulator n=1 Tax=Virgibacillus halodenitrificans TaxID=1482 RepID=UPI001FB4B2E7|nr:LuxR C-terminal-related transcriptional regulator [Virgibacillus halodenitrificans]MCJ0932563.1 LuxR C-terminal-related transcriptional regulator [Virgibacillus halodenitrificans]